MTAFVGLVKRISGALALLGLLAGPACVGSARAADHLTLMTDWTPYGVHGPLFLAQQKGWLKKAGLDIDIRDGKGSVTTIQLVAAGTVDIGFAQLATMASGLDKGMSLTSIVGWIRAGDNGVMVPLDSPIKTIKDLAGKRIVYAQGGASASLMDAFFSLAHLNRDDLHLVGVDPSALASTYVAGNVAAAIAPIAYIGPIIAQKKPSRSFSYASVGLVVPSFGLVVRRSELKDHKAALAKLVPILNRAWAYTKDGHVKQAIDAILAARPNARLDPKVMTGQLEAYLKLMDTPATKGKPIGWQAASDWKQAASDLLKAGMIKKALPPSAYYTNRFIPE